MDTVKRDKNARNVFERLAALNEEAIDAFLTRDWSHFFDALKRINSLRRELGMLSGVPVEPPELDPIRRKIERLGYVTVLPGAGGYDAIVAVGLRTNTTKKEVKLKEIEEVPLWLRHGRTPI